MAAFRSVALSLSALLTLFYVAETQNETIQACDNPVYCYGELLDDIQTMEVFQDSKRFVDMPMRADPDTVLSAYNNLANITVDTLTQFVQEWFDLPGSDLMPWEPPDWTESPKFIDSISNEQYKEWASSLNGLWKTFGKKLNQSVYQHSSRHSLLAVNNPFIAPGGRFIEFYYWDSYWIIKGLLLCEMFNTTQGMIRNMGSLIERYGFVPNGGRVYYTKRSQPPLLTWMVYSYYEATNDTGFVKEMLPMLDKEYQFWMTNRSVYVPGCDCTANRYASTANVPRPESYREDIETASEVSEELQPELYSNIMSAAESGWDFSSRWLSTSGPMAGQLSSMRAKSIIPVDLNAILGANEILLYKLHRITGFDDFAEDYASAWTRRHSLFENLLWAETEGLYKDWSLEEGSHLNAVYASSLTPFYTYSLDKSLFNNTKGRLTLGRLKSLGFLGYPGGLPTSQNSTGQQWDFPNAWAPLQWFLVKGWEGADDQELNKAARNLTETWLRSNYQAWIQYNHSMFEKYNCTASGQPGGGGEYSLQSGFGWTNGVVLDLLSSYYTTNPPTVTTSSPSRSPYLWFIALVPISLFLLVTLLCICWCHYLYRNGKRRYWDRVRHEQLLHSSGSSEPQSPMVFSNQDAIDDNEDGGAIINNVYRRSDV
ncbi:PREDICTED: trehalase-like [Amphimedon queenslandica]|uniref:Trehalase n=1 Tax=Amphimedon queenslandica TaxID=400682 RepID=A0A1X7UY09_AMPQE|nr:PREDICTED: trehalase-like [Amphimedon queenslandica]|eukprot:XP_019851831.1 PREDICTED: trehalase-like [Amphimedon queenslandica]